MACSSCASNAVSRLRRSCTSCSRNAIVTAPVAVSPVILANSSAIRQVSASLIFSLIVTTKPQQLTSQPSLEPFRLLVTQLVYSRGHARQPTGCEEGTRSVRHGFGGGRCGGAAPAQGRAEGPTAQNTTMRGERTPLLASFRGAYQLRLSSYVLSLASNKDISPADYPTPSRHPRAVLARQLPPRNLQLH